MYGYWSHANFLWITASKNHPSFSIMGGRWCLFIMTKQVTMVALCSHGRRLGPSHPVMYIKGVKQIITKAPPMAAGWAPWSIIVKMVHCWHATDGTTVKNSASKVHRILHVPGIVRGPSMLTAIVDQSELSSFLQEMEDRLSLVVFNNWFFIYRHHFCLVSTLFRRFQCDTLT
jgi:hypothetical protein